MERDGRWTTGLPGGPLTKSMNDASPSVNRDLIKSGVA
jgi:hypothetical protein